eukprot:TRINITY_DN93170_c0_g1_i1.p1 TRINITY_DN93170_c0_g1~~TRINITY_DN93170_c0_g1_i1.p1  ORF type:complete len:697 (-),score=185.83 TRINITY_DN93170_c0_g1_i1:363-2453(-)
MTEPSPTCGGTSGVLPAERAKCSFDLATLKVLMSQNRDQEAIGEFKRKLFSGAPFDNAEMKDYYSYEENFTKTLERTGAALTVMKDPNNRKLMLQHMAGKVQMRDMFQTGSLGIHFSMFLTFIKTNASEEQQKEWLGRATQGQFFGAYAQTELGHGSNVRGLETTAVFDKEADEFVIHSPTLTSLKWWPTGMYACTHAAVFANLIIDGKNYGFHGFMVQLRDDQGHMMPGVEVGEMGPKINNDNTNIGYARFTQVRIPRWNMFAKYQQVSRDGTYTAPPRQLSKFRYISMMQIRMFIVGWSFRDLARAATIAVRYSCVRRQGFKDTTIEDPLGKGIGENFIIDYKVQQYRVFKSMSLAYCFYWNALYVLAYLNRIQATVASGTDAERDAAAAELPELHATLSGLKVWSTLYAHTQIEDCRKACGGQGYLRSSGICDIMTDFAEPATVEGEQVIMSFQVARFLIKAVADADAGRPLVGSVTYLKEKPLGKLTLTSYDGATETLVGLLRDRANRYARKLAAAFAASKAKGHGFDASLNSSAVLAYKAAECHSMYIFVRNNFEALKENVTDESVMKVLTRMLDLVLLTQVRENAGDWLNALDEAQLELVEARIDALLGELRPDCVSLVDAFNFPDDALESTLGRYDGNVYEAIYDEARKSPLNKTSRMIGWEYLAPHVDKDFLKDGMKKQRAGANASKL